MQAYVSGIRKGLFLIGLFFVWSSQLVIAQSCSGVFISEYIEGSSFNKAIELFNGAPAPIDLRKYEVRIFSNGDTIANYRIRPQDSLAPGDVYVIAHTSWGLDSTVVDTLYGGLQFNGNDAVALYKDSVLVDVIGVIGVDPGTSWSVGSGSTKDYTLVRADSMRQGDTNWTSGSTTWLAFAQDQDSLLGRHNSDCISGPPNAGFFVSDTIICEHQSLKFTDTSSNYPVFYTWIFEGGEPDTTNVKDPAVYYDSSGIYQVTLIVGNGKGYDTVKKNSYIQVLSDNGLNTSWNKQDVRCFGGIDGSIDLSVTGGTAPFQYQWSNGDTVQDVNNLPQDTFMVTVTDSNQCFIEDTIVVGEPSPIMVNKGAEAATEGNYDGIAWVDVSGGNPPYNYQWYDSLMQTTDTATQLKGGGYLVVITDSSSCVDSNKVLVPTEVPPGWQEHGSFSQLQLYPNPVDKYLFVRWTGEASLRPDSKLIILNTIGEIVQQQKLGLQQKISTHSLPQGYYRMLIIIQGAVVQRSFVVVHHR